MLRSLFFSLILLFPICLISQSSEVEKALHDFEYQKALILLDATPSTRENLLLKVHCHEKLHNYSAALDIYKGLSGQYPDDVNLAIAMAECASQMGDSGQSLRYWLMADSLSPDNQFIQTQKALALYNNNLFEAAIEQAHIVFKSDSVPSLLRMVGDAYLYSSVGDSAVWYYSKAIGKNPEDYQAVNKLGNIYFGAKFYDATIELTETYLRNVNPKQLKIAQLNGIAHFSANHYPEATQRLEEIVALGDSSYTTCYYLGMSLYASKQFYDAIPWLEKAYHKNNSDVHMLYYYGTALSRTYDRQKGIEILTEGVAKIEEMNAMLFDFDRSFADAYLRSTNYAKALEYFQSAYRRKPDNHYLLYDIAGCYDSMDDYNNAIAYYELLLKTAPEGWEEAVKGKNDGQITRMESFYMTASSRIEKLKESLLLHSTEKNLN